MLQWFCEMVPRTEDLVITVPDVNVFSMNGVQMAKSHNCSFAFICLQYNIL